MSVDWERLKAEQSPVIQNGDKILIYMIRDLDYSGVIEMHKIFCNGSRHGKRTVNVCIKGMKLQ